jgi:MerR family mercuric resistance operon transcriptional regulator
MASPSTTGLTNSGLTISGLAKAGGVGVETVRFYQRRGLLRAPARPSKGSGAGVRRYEHDDVMRLRFIRSAQTVGFTLDQIKELLTLDAEKDRKRARDLAYERVRVLDEKIAAMKAARQSLIKLAQLCAKSHKCPIIPTLGQ